ncbi:hypothetical protein Verru16b_02327 [Lacunisphaera limnophila]|uniref:Porin domain-containing protein n=1 Tax=Lacunisphaera limnophila TaxID=1838286 RepID=A0A1D8AWH2_9BACT|nr:outer membrane beta-barrel protein [Lacunisphaera limnophila]AOS45248.1 hypothetical protein Verru16b_02327 [Lacunisphaera limnophila]
MTKQSLRLAGWATALLSLAGTAAADIKLNENFSVSGYVSGTAFYQDDDLAAGGSADDSFMDVDAVKLSSIASFEKLTGTVSLHTFNTSDLVVLDAFATYSLDGGSSVTVGKFLSYLGYEAFDYPNMLQISYANNSGFSGYIPAYHSGVRYDFSGEGVSGGVAVLDSVNPGAGYWKGDGDLDNGAGFEAYLKFSKGDASLFTAIAYDDGANLTNDDLFTFDVWAQTKVSGVTLAAEYCYSQLSAPAGDTDGYFWLLLAMGSLNDKWTLTGRLSGGEEEGAGDAEYVKATISPAVTITPNLGVLFEYSYFDYKNYWKDSSSFFATQVIFKF